MENMDCKGIYTPIAVARDLEKTKKREGQLRKKEEISLMKSTSMAATASSQE